MDQQEPVIIVETPSRLRSIITSRPVKYLGAAVAGALSVVALSALRNHAQVEGAMLVLESETDSTED